MIYIAISASLKENKVQDLIDKVNKIKEDLFTSHREVCLIDGFLTEDICRNKGINSEFTKFLDEAFTMRINFFNGELNKVERDKMTDFAKEKNATVYIIEPIVYGVKEEYELYKTKGCDIKIIR